MSHVIRSYHKNNKKIIKFIRWVREERTYYTPLFTYIKNRNEEVTILQKKESDESSKKRYKN